MVTDVSVMEGTEGSLRGRAVAGPRAVLVFLRSNAQGAQVIRFVWHYVQMSIAMELGMLLPAGSPLGARSLRPGGAVARGLGACDDG